MQVARENVPFGIYAIEKNGYAELMNVHVMSRTKLKEHVRAYRSQGYKVYTNDKG